MSDLQILLDLTLVFSTILIIAALAGYMSEKVGIVNIGIDGMMCIGLFFLEFLLLKKLILLN